MIRLAAAELTLPGATMQEKYAFVRSVGFDGIELAGLGGGTFSARSREFARAREEGVVMCSTVTNTGSFIGALDEAERRHAIDEMKDLLTTTATAGGVGVVSPHTYGVFSRRLPPFEPPRTDAESRRLLIDALRELGDHAEAQGVQVLLEPLNRYEDWMVNTLADAARIVDAVGSAGVAVIADTYHMSIEEVSIGDAIRACGSRICHVQLGDSNRLEPGAGHYDWAETLGALDDIDFDGWLAMECRLSGPVQEVLPKVAALLRR